MAFRIQLRRDEKNKWASNNPILLEGEFGYETDTGSAKIGDGKTHWNELPYFVINTPGPTGGVNP